ncbi:gap junction alpha-9 protein [Molossus molossus]|uniref:Gap junction protein n=1 Tax=Molossus molossus TaxID=27622 RepID=A0A7J8F8E9_MOLMO|nr:gap junction alpha-9 protein [Molossus molossus]KAF6443855.1 gap junction protein alpha 9 [Molossus molossus]
MGDWNFLGGILEEVHIHSTMIGKIWLTTLFIFRMLVLGVAAENVWNDEQSGFICNTEQPGCRNVCYDQAFPISLIRYWVLQVIFVSSPSLVYMGHALYRLRVLEKERQREKVQLRGELKGIEFEMSEDRRRLEQELCQLAQRKFNKAPLRGTLLCTYVIHIFARSVVEVGFMIGQYLLYGFHLEPLFKCHGYPCPNIIDCFVSRPTEKTTFLLFMQSIATVSLFLNVLEIFHLGFKKIKRGLWGQYKWEDEHKNEFYSNRSKQNLTKYQITAANSLKRFSSAPDYNLIVEKPTHTTVYPGLNSPVHQAYPDNHNRNDEKCILDEQETVLSDEMCTLSTTCSCIQCIGSSTNENSHKISAKDVNGNQLRKKREIDGKNSKRNQYPTGHCSIPGVAIDLDSHMGQSPQTAFSLPANCIWKPRWLRATWSPSTGDENWVSPPNANLKGRSREGTIRTLSPLEEFQPPDIPDTPNSFGELSFGSELVRTCNNPTACPQNQLVLLTNDLISRRATTDLQI